MTPNSQFKRFFCDRSCVLIFRNKATNRTTLWFINYQSPIQGGHPRDSHLKSSVMSNEPLSLQTKDNYFKLMLPVIFFQGAARILERILHEDDQHIRALVGLNNPNLVSMWIDVDSHYWIVSVYLVFILLVICVLIIVSIVHFSILVTKTVKKQLYGQLQPLGMPYELLLICLVL